MAVWPSVECTLDVSLGSYLSPEPLLQSPGYMTTMASRGMQVPTYAYAANNPLRYVDRDGLDAYLVNCGGNVGHTDVYVDNACYGPESDPNRSVVGGGFYCAGFPSANALQNLRCVFAAPGEWRASPPPFTSPAAFADRCNDPSRLQVTHIPLSCEDTAAALSRMQSVAASPPTYSAGLNNCHGVAQDIALGDGNRCLFPQNGPFRSGSMVPLYCPR